MSTRSQQVASNRDRYPEIAAVVDALREAFGEVHVISLHDKQG